VRTLFRLPWQRPAIAPQRAALTLPVVSLRVVISVVTLETFAAHSREQKRRKATCTPSTSATFTLAAASRTTSDWLHSTSRRTCASAHTHSCSGARGQGMGEDKEERRRGERRGYMRRRKLWQLPLRTLTSSLRSLLAIQKRTRRLLSPLLEVLELA